jgi:hypothetical protein
MLLPELKQAQGPLMQTHTGARQGVACGLARDLFPSSSDRCDMSGALEGMHAWFSKSCPAAAVDTWSMSCGVSGFLSD